VSDERQVCARCGHETPTCPRCDQTWPFLGGNVNGLDVCHTFSNGPNATCYEALSRQETRRFLDADTSWTPLRELLDVYRSGRERATLRLGAEWVDRPLPERGDDE
jgi:hypothetical protein